MRAGWQHAVHPITTSCLGISELQVWRLVKTAKRNLEAPSLCYLQLWELPSQPSEMAAWTSELACSRWTKQPMYGMKEFRKYRLDILGLTKMRWPDWVWEDEDQHRRIHPVLWIRGGLPKRSGSGLKKEAVEWRDYECQIQNSICKAHNNTRQPMRKKREWRMNFTNSCKMN